MAALAALALTGCVLEEAPAPSCASRVQALDADLPLEPRPEGFWQPGLERPVPLLGANLYYAQEDVARGRRQRVAQVMDQAAGMGMVALRVWAFHSRSGGRPGAIQVGPEGFQEEGLVALDEVVAMAQERGLRLLLTLSNHWEDYGGLPAYARWAGLPYGAQALASAEVRRMFAALIERVVGRQNTLTGRWYREDPTILGWELVNELRCQGEGCDPALPQSFLLEAAAELRRWDQLHPLGAGDEGFFGELGVDAAALADSQAFSWVSVHLWPQHHAALRDEQGQERWRPAQAVARGRQRLRAAARLGRRHGLPVLVGELGWPRQGDSDWERAAVLGALLEEARRQQVAGVFVWGLADAQRPDYDGYSIYAERDEATRAVLCEAAQGREVP